MTKPTCATCPFWAEMTMPQGECRRHTPSLVDPLHDEDDLDFSGYWPETSHDAWCGEHPDFAAYAQAVSEDRVRCGSLVQDNWNRRTLRCNLDAGHTGAHDFTVDRQPPSK